jgi:hypothetical protein
LVHGTLSKYFGQDPDLYGFQIHGHTDAGFPVRGNPGYLKQEESDQLPIRAEFKADWFRLWVAEERGRFVEIMNHVSNGLFTVRTRRDVEVQRPGDDGNDLKVWLEWVQWYAEAGNLAFAPQVDQAPYVNLPLGGSDG